MDTKTLYAKLATVPPPIKTHLGSEGTIDMLEKIENQFHLPAGSLGATKLIQKLQIKDLSPEYFAGELATELKLEKNNALLISDAIKKMVLAPIKKDFADYGIDISLLEKFQISTPKTLSEIKPPVSPSSLSSPVGSAIQPMMIAENFKAATVAIPKPPTAPAPQWKPQPVTSQTASGLNVNTTPSANNKNLAASAPLPPTAKPPADKGWSRQGSTDPVVRLGVMTPGTPKPATTPGPVTPSPKPPAAAAITPSSPTPPTPLPPAPKPTKGISEFDRLDAMKKGPTTQTPPQTSISTSAKPPSPPPVMLHQVSPSSVQQSPEFRITTGIQNQINKNSAPGPMPNRPAVIEFGPNSGSGSSGMPAPISRPMPAPAPRPAQPPAPQTPPRPPMPPTQPARPLAPSPQPPQSTKVVVKDFL